MTILYDKINSIPWSNSFIVIKHKQYTIVEFIQLAVKYDTYECLAEKLQVNKLTITNNIKRFLPEISDNSCRRKLSTKLLNFLELIKCTKCMKVQEKDKYYLTSSQQDNWCISCRKGYYTQNKEERLQANAKWVKNNPEKRRGIQAKARAKRLNRVPNWSETELIAKFYLNCPEGYHVDHIIPLCGKAVSGLHVIKNLQYLTPNRKLD